MKYRLSEAATVDLDNGRVKCSFKAGDHTPKDDAEAEALEHLATLELAERVGAKGTEEA